MKYPAAKVETVRYGPFGIFKKYRLRLGCILFPDAAITVGDFRNETDAFITAAQLNLELSIREAEQDTKELSAMTKHHNFTKEPDWEPRRPSSFESSDYVKYVK